MDFLDNISTTSSSTDSAVSGVAVTLSSVALLCPKKEPKTITDLPSELILHIYGDLDSGSEITALNKTSRLCYLIWRANAASISDAVLGGMESYNIALELFEAEERLKQIHCLILPHSEVVKRVRIALRQARAVVQGGLRIYRCDYTSTDALYGGVLYRNEEVLSSARKATSLVGLIERRVVYSGGTSLDEFDRKIAPSSLEIIAAYHEVMILTRLRVLEAMEQRLKTMCNGSISKLIYVAKYLACDCPDRDKIRLGISHRVALQVIPCTYSTDDLDFALPRCRISIHARRALWAIANAGGDLLIPQQLRDNWSGCHGDCEGIGEGIGKMEAM